MEHVVYNVDSFYNEFANVTKFLGEVKEIILKDIKSYDQNPAQDIYGSIRKEELHRSLKDLEKSLVDIATMSVILGGFFNDLETFDTLTLSSVPFKEIEVSIKELVEVQHEVDCGFLYEEPTYSKIQNSMELGRFEYSFDKISAMAYKFIYASLDGRELTLMSGATYRPHVYQAKGMHRGERIKFLSVKTEEELRSNLKAFIMLIQNEVEKVLSVEEINSMIDFALDTRDFNWVNELVERKNKLTQAQ